MSPPEECTFCGHMTTQLERVNYTRYPSDRIVLWLCPFCMESTLPQTEAAGLSEPTNMALGRQISAGFNVLLEELRDASTDD